MEMGKVKQKILYLNISKEKIRENIVYFSKKHIIIIKKRKNNDFFHRGFIWKSYIYDIL